MPTGVEEAGLVLAVWPIAMGALKFYAEERGVSSLTILVPKLYDLLCDQLSYHFKSSDKSNRLSRTSESFNELYKSITTTWTMPAKLFARSRNISVHLWQITSE
jgi:hypothetical protein